MILLYHIRFEVAWEQEEKGTTEDEMAGCHHWLNGRESEWTLGVGDGQGGLACCDSWGHKESDTTERLNWTERKKTGLPRWLSDKESTCQCRKPRRCRFNPWVGKIPWRRKWQPTSVFLPGETHGQRSLESTVHRVTKSQTRLSAHTHTHTHTQKGRKHKIKI